MSVDLAALPRPILDDHPDFAMIHDVAWRIAATHVMPHPKTGRPFVDVAWNFPPHVYEWVWDSCFIALYCRYAPDQYPAMHSLDNFYDLQRPDGYISMTYDLTTGEEPYPDRINPPLFAWVEWEYYRTTGDSSRFARATAHIEKLMAWIDANRRPLPWRNRPSPLYCFRDCGSSGMDDSPRTPRHPEAGKYFEWIDLSSQMALSCRCLAAMHRVLKQADRARQREARAKEIGRAINERLWCAKKRFYYDRNMTARLVDVRTAASFWPLLAGICSEAQKDALVEALLDENRFNRPVPVPSLSADDPNYSPKGEYWIGGVWPPICYMVMRGLQTAARGDAAHFLALKYVAALARTYRKVKPHTLWECQSPEEDKPGLAAYTTKWVKPEFCGWSAIGPTAMLYENVLGLEPDAPARRLTWTIRLTGRHGVENLSLGRAGKVSVLCEARRSAKARARVTVCAEKGLTLVLRCAGRETRLKAPAGRSVSATA